jgi:chaperonin GroES
MEIDMQLQPLYDRVLIRRIKAEDKTAAGIVIPDTAKEKPQRGVVVEVGTGKTLDDGRVRPIDVKPGDQVMFGRYSGDEIVLDDVDHVILKAEDLLAIVH